MANGYFQNGIASSSSGADSFIIDPITVTGAVIWVDSVNGNDSNAGTEDKPLASLTQAITNATSNNGDVIVIKSGHAKSISSALVINKTVKIFGLGSGSSAPNFTVIAAVDGIQITAPGVELNNLYFPVGTTATNTCRVKIDAANVRLKNCTFLGGASDSDAVLITANGLYAKLTSCSFTVSAAGPTSAVTIQSALAVGVRLESCSFDGGSYYWSNAAVYSTVAHTGFVYDSLTLTNRASIVHTAAAKGYASNLSVGADCRVAI